MCREGLVEARDAAWFGMIIRCMDLAIVSDLAATNAILNAERPAQVDSIYMRELENQLLLLSMQMFAGWHHILSNPRLFDQYLQIA